MKNTFIFCLTLHLCLLSYAQSICENETVKRCKKGQIITIECDTAMLMSAATFKSITSTFSVLKERDSMQRKLNALYSKQITQNQKDYDKLLMCYDSLSKASQSFASVQQQGITQIIGSIDKMSSDLKQAQQMQVKIVKSQRKEDIKNVFKKIGIAGAGFSLGFILAIISSNI